MRHMPGRIQRPGEAESSLQNRLASLQPQKKGSRHGAGERSVIHRPRAKPENSARACQERGV